MSARRTRRTAVAWIAGLLLGASLPQETLGQAAPSRAAATGGAGDAATADWLASTATPGRHGGRLVTALRAEPRTWNPVLAVDNPSRDIIRRIHADLATIDRETQATELALARAIERSPDGRRMTIRLRRGIRFSDGDPFDADDVVFSFAVYQDARVDSPQRDLLTVHGQPIGVRKLDTHTVELAFAAPYGPAERLFDSVAMLPSHLLEPAYRAGTLAKTWTLGSDPSTMAGLGPFRLARFTPGQSIVLERNPHYWKRDRAGGVLPYLDQLVFVFAPNEDAQALRLEAGELDAVDRVGAEAFERLQRTAGARLSLLDLGASLDYTFVMFNRNDLPASAPAALGQRQRWFSDARFRRAVSLAIDRDAMVSLVYRGKATPLWWHVSPSNRAWVNRSIPPARRSLGAARALLTEAGFSWNAAGALLDSMGTPVAFSLLTSSSNAQRTQLATMLQADLKLVGITLTIVPLEFGTLLERVLRTHDYDAALMALSSGDVDPGSGLNVWKSSGSNHLWRLNAAAPTGVEQEIDRLLDEQMATVDAARRKGLFDRVQALVVEDTPIVTLVGPNVLIAVGRDLGNVRAGVLDHHFLWNADELYWRSPRPTR